MTAAWATVAASPSGTPRTTSAPFVSPGDSSPGRGIASTGTSRPTVRAGWSPCGSAASRSTRSPTRRRRTAPGSPTRTGTATSPG